MEFIRTTLTEISQELHGADVYVKQILELATILDSRISAEVYCRRNTSDSGNLEIDFGETHLV